MKTLLLVLTLLACRSFATPVTPMVTGNGFGFAVAPLTENALTRFYVHPYKFTAMNPANPFGDGFQTHNLLQRLSWPDDAAAPLYVYAEESHVIMATTLTGKYFYYMPFGLSQPAVVLYRQNAGKACLVPQWNFSVVSNRTLSAGGLTGMQFKFDGINDSALVIPLSSSGQMKSDCFSDSDAWLVVGLETWNDANAALKDVAKWRGTLTPEQLTWRELSAFEAWRVPQPTDLSLPELRMWRQSETVLRMAQSREPNRTGRYNHGLIVASLPEGGWFMPWVRDMSYGLLALIRMGHRQEARWGVEAYFNARPIGRVKDMVRGYDYQVSVVRYFGDGSEETDFGGENAPNVEFDNWGNVLNMLTEYVERYDDKDILKQQSARGTVYVSARDLIAKPLIGNFDAAGDGMIVAKDTSVWEANAGSEQHFAYTTAAAIQGLRGFGRMAAIMKDAATVKSMNAQVARLEKGFKNAFVQDGFIHGTQEDNYVYNIDSGVLECHNFGAIDDVSVVRSTLTAMEQLKMVSGGYRRIRGDRQYDKQEFLFSNFNWARNYLRLHEPATAAPLVALMVAKSLDDHGLIPEMYVSEVNDEYPGAIGAPAGSMPMVGYGAGMMILYLQERDAL